MKYNVENQLDLFEFHDSEFSLISFDNDKLIVSVKYLNIHKNSLPNPSDYDMEIENAIITFKGFHVTYCKTYSYSNEVNIYYNQEAAEKFKEEFNGDHREHLNIFDLGKLDNSQYYIDANGVSIFFSIHFSYDKVTTEWDEYRKKAWYEPYKYYQQDVTLLTPNGEESITAGIRYQYRDSSEDPVYISVNIKYNDKQLYGTTTTPLLLDALTNLQEKLPEGVTLKTDSIK